MNLEPQLRGKCERLKKARSMTIAAGVVCSDGIVLAADTEHTRPFVAKYQKPKVFISPDNNLGVTGAGTSDYIKVAFDKLCEKIKVPSGPLEARRNVEDVIAKMHEQHIVPF